MGEIVEGVIHGKTIELAVDPGLQDGGVVEVVNRGSNNRERGALAHQLSQATEGTSKINRSVTTRL